MLKVSAFWAGTDDACPKSDDTDAASRKKWELENNKAMTIIVSLLDKRQTTRIYNCDTTLCRCGTSYVATFGQQPTERTKLLHQVLQDPNQGCRICRRRFRANWRSRRSTWRARINLEETTVLTKFVSVIPDGRFPPGLAQCKRYRTNYGYVTKSSMDR